jgi:hypothetical protein
MEPYTNQPGIADHFKEVYPLFSLATNIIYTSALFLLILSWIAATKASKLLYGGSAERLHRKARKQMVWAAYISVPSIALITATLLMSQSMDSVYWLDRVLLHLSLAITSLLAIWLFAIPRLWKLWRETRKLTGAPLPLEIRKQAAHPMVILPFQMTGLATVTIFYFLLVSPVPLQLTKSIVPVLIWVTASAAIWYAHDRRRQKVSAPDATILYQPLRSRLLALGVLCVAAGLAGVAEDGVAGAKLIRASLEIHWRNPEVELY